MKTIQEKAGSTLEETRQLLKQLKLSIHNPNVDQLLMLAEISVNLTKLEQDQLKLMRQNENTVELLKKIDESMKPKERVS